MAPLSFIARRRNRTSKPLRRLASAVRVNIEAKEPYTVKLGWTGPRVSKRWKHLAKVHQEGFVEPVTEELRRRFRILGGRLGKRSKVRQYLFLKKTTTEFETPARPIMDPFWRAYELKTWENIRRNWNHKVRDI